MQRTPLQSGLSMPAGHIMVHSRWRGTNLLKLLQAKLSVLFIEAADSVVDFYPSNHAAIIYLIESDILSLSDGKRRVAKLRKARNIISHRVLFAKTGMTEQYFPQIQKMVVVDCGMDIFPVISEMEAADFIIRMSHQDIQTPSHNPFRSRPKNVHGSIPVDSAILQTVMLFPRVGEAKAKALLEKFKSIRAITEASTEELATVIGMSSAKNLKLFFET